MNVAWLIFDGSFIEFFIRKPGKPGYKCLKLRMNEKIVGDVLELEHILNDGETLGTFREVDHAVKVISISLFYLG